MTIRFGEYRSRTQMRSGIHYQASFFWPVANLRPNSKILAFFFMLSAPSVPTETHLTQMTRSSTQSTVVSLPSRNEDGEGNTAQGLTKHTSDFFSPYLSIRHWAKNEGSFSGPAIHHSFYFATSTLSPPFFANRKRHEPADGWRRREREKRPVL